MEARPKELKVTCPPARHSTRVPTTKHKLPAHSPLHEFTQIPLVVHPRASRVNTTADEAKRKRGRREKSTLGGESQIEKREVYRNPNRDELGKKKRNERRRDPYVHSLFPLAWEIFSLSASQIESPISKLRYFLHPNFLRFSCCFFFFFPRENKIDFFRFYFFFLKLFFCAWWFSRRQLVVIGVLRVLIDFRKNETEKILYMCDYSGVFVIF